MSTDIDPTVASLVVDVDDPSMPLLYVLRDNLGLRGPHFGCGLGQCGACTVHYYGEALRSCIVPISAVSGAEIVTLEGLGAPENPHPLQEAFIDEQAAQCGYCINGMIMQAAALLARNGHPTEAEVGRNLRPISANAERMSAYFARSCASPRRVRGWAPRSHAAVT